MERPKIGPIGIALIGYGGIGRVHAQAYRALPFHYGLPSEHIRIVGVATAHQESAQRAAQELGCELWSDDYRTLLERQEVDMIDCMTPNTQHHQVVCAAAQAGKHVYCEKPLALTVGEAEEMLQAVVAARVRHQMTFNFRFFPALQRAKQLIEEGRIGRIFSFHGRYFRPSYIDPQRPMSWRLQKKYGGGALTDIGSHIIDIVAWLLGPIDSIYATLETLIDRRPLTDNPTTMQPVDVDDLNLLQLRLTQGGCGTIEVSRMGSGTTNDMSIEIYGAEGALRFYSNNPSWLEYYNNRDSNQPLGGERGFRRVESVQRYTGQRAPDWTMPANFVRTHAECQYQFIRAIQEEREATPSLAAGLAVQQVMEAAQLSAAQQRWIKVGDGT